MEIKNNEKIYNIKHYNSEKIHIHEYEYIAISNWSAFDSVIMPNRSDSDICRKLKCCKQENCECNKVPIEGFFQPTEFTLALKKKENDGKITYEKINKYSKDYPEDYSEILNFPCLQNNDKYYHKYEYFDGLKIFIGQGYIPVIISKQDMTLVFRQDALDLFLKNPAIFDRSGCIVFARSKLGIPINNQNEKYEHNTNIKKILKNSPLPLPMDDDYIDYGIHSSTLLQERDAEIIMEIMRYFIVDDDYNYMYNYTHDSEKNVLFIGADAGACY